MAAAGKVCVLGAGSSGIASCQVLHARGIPFDCFEKGSGVGGNWRYENDNEMSSAYRSLFINTSRNLMEYASYPMPSDYPDYPHHTQIAAYFDDYVDHFGFREAIRFRTEVTKVEPRDGAWEVHWRDAEGSAGSELYRSVFVANGHHWDPRWPEPPFPGEFAGEQLHSHHYKTPDGMEGKSVLVVGIGNSAMDIACETSRVSKMTYLSARRGAWIIPKYVGSTPTDELGGEFVARLPFAVLRALYHRRILKQQGKPQDYGLPEPDHKLGEAHPTISSEILPRIGHGRVTPKPNIARLQGERVEFEDGSVEDVDVIVYCTGYRISFPFLSPEIVDASEDNVVPAYRRVVHPDQPGLYFIGLVQPLGAIMPIAEAQSEWLADVLEGKTDLPSPEEMKKVIAREDARMRKRYVASKRHTIQVDFYPYLRTIRRERKRRRRAGGSRVAGRSHELRLDTPG
jgi:dimethylaniline monooxygenase (N-oxide forming)